MIHLTIIPWEAEFKFFQTLSYFFVTILLIIGLRYIFKSRVYHKGVAGPLLLALMSVLFPILILILPPLIGDRGGYRFATVVLFWVLGILVVFFIILINLVNSNKNVLMEIEAEKTDSKEKRAKEYSGLKTGAVIIFVCALMLLIFSAIGLTWNSLSNLFLIILNVVISIIILVGSVYSLSSDKYFTFGSIICVVGGVSMIIFPFFFIKNHYGYGFSFPFNNDIITFTLGILPIFGVIAGKKAGSIFCIVMGVVNFVISYLMVGYGVGGGFLTIFPSIQFEPILMMIGGYFLYQKQART